MNNRQEKPGEKKHFDIVIVGAGVVGCAIARELARYSIGLAVLEKNPDVGLEASCRNSGVVHAGFNCEPGTLKAELCVQGNGMFHQWCRELDVPFKPTGKLVVGFDQDDQSQLEELLHCGRANGVPGLAIIGPREMSAIQPVVNGRTALWSSSTAITDPMLFTIALAENALENGATFYFNHQVTSIKKKQDLFQIQAGGQTFTSHLVVNASGLAADRMARLAGVHVYRQYPCRGQYHVLDSKLSHLLKVPVYPVPRPGSGGLGIHLTPTIHGNILLGPSAEYIRGRTDYATTTPVMEELLAEARQLLPDLPANSIIRSYSGIRSKLTGPRRGGFADYVIEASPQVEGLINLLGIESPGLTAAPAIARYVVDLIQQRFPLIAKPDFLPVRRDKPQLHGCSHPEAARLVEKNSGYGEIVCRCEEVSRQEILNALDNPLGAHTLASIKHRTRALMGRCQGGYCLCRIIELMEEAGELLPSQILLHREGSFLLPDYLRK